jgi:hypothetical protein
LRLSLKFKTFFPRCIRQGFDAAMIEKSSSIKNDFLHAQGLQTRCNQLAHFFGHIHFLDPFEFAGQFLAERRRCRNGRPLGIVNYLSIDVFIRPEYGKTGSFRGSRKFAPDSLLSFISYLSVFLEANVPPL